MKLTIFTGKLCQVLGEDFSGMIPFKLHNNLGDLVIFVVLWELTGNFLLAGGWHWEFDTKPELLIIKTPGLCSPSPSLCLSSLGLCLSHSGALPSTLRLSFPLSLGLYPRVCAHSSPCPCLPSHLWLFAFLSLLPLGWCRCHCEWRAPLCSLHSATFPLQEGILAVSPVDLNLPLD